MSEGEIRFLEVTEQGRLVLLSEFKNGGCNALVIKGTCNKLAEYCLTTPSDTQFRAEFMLMYRTFMPPLVFGQHMLTAAIGAKPSILETISFYLSNYYAIDVEIDRSMEEVVLRIEAVLSTPDKCSGEDVSKIQELFQRYVKPRTVTITTFADRFCIAGKVGTGIFISQSSLPEEKDILRGRELLEDQVRVGDEVLAINQMDCTNMSLETAWR